MYNRNSTKKRVALREWIILGICVIAICGFIITSERGAVVVYEGMTFTAHTIIPSIFPVMLISDLMTRSGALEHICSLFAPLMHKLRLNPSLLTPLIVGSVCGFPAGAKCVRKSQEQGLISTKEADCILASSNCASPAFVISAVGIGMYSSMLKGLVLWLFCYLSCITLSFVLIPKQKETCKLKVQNTVRGAVSFSELFCESVKSTSASMLNMFCLITFFHSLCKTAVYAFERAGVSHVYSSILSGILEIGSGCNSASYLSDPYSICITAFSVGFGGLCVFFQVKNEAHKNASMLPYLTIKAVCGIISTFFAYFILQY